MARSRKTHNASFGSVTRLPSGRYRVRYTGPDGLRRAAPSTFGTKTGAEEWLARARADITRDVWSAPERGLVPFGDYLEEWLASRVDLRPTTLALYRNLANRWLLFPRGGVELEPMPLSSITPELVRRWYAGVLRDAHESALGRDRPSVSSSAGAARQWAQSHGYEVASTGRLPVVVRRAWDEAGRPNARKPRDETQAGRTVAAQAYRLLRSVLYTATRDGVLDVNPCQIARAGQVRAPERLPATIEQVDVIAEQIAPRYKAAVLVAAWSGLRSGELFAMRRRDVDTRAGTLRVERTMTEVDGRVGFGPPKSDAGRRTVALPPSIAAALQRHLVEFTDSDLDALVFTTGTGRPVTSAQRAPLLARPKLAAGRPDLTWHHLRHTGMTLAAATGAPLAQLQRRLGQSTVRAALIYQHASDDADRLLANALEHAVTTGTAPVIPLRRSS